MNQPIDLFLASTLRESGIRPQWSEIKAIDPAAVRRRIDYHGIAPILARKSLTGWSPDLQVWIRDQARFWAMWELRHRVVVAGLLTKLSDHGIPAVLLKGTALAFDVYESPDLRPRGDTDLLIDPQDLQAARKVLHSKGFDPDSDSGAGDFDLQQIWVHKAPDGTRHTLDLHWQVLNTPALSAVLETTDCIDNARRLKSLGPSARALDRPRLLLHACIHRALHVTSPYFVDDRTYYGGERLIWACDIDLLARALSAFEWTRVCDLAKVSGAGPIVLDGLEFATRSLATVIPEEIKRELLDQGSKGRTARYLLHSGQLARHFADWRATPGMGAKVAYLRAKVFRSKAFLRSKYPSMRNWPIAVLFLRRVVELFRNRPAETRS